MCLVCAETCHLGHEVEEDTTQVYSICPPVTHAHYSDYTVHTYAPRVNIKKMTFLLVLGKNCCDWWVQRRTRADWLLVLNKPLKRGKGGKLFLMKKAQKDIAAVVLCSLLICLHIKTTSKTHRPIYSFTQFHRNLINTFTQCAYCT